MDGGLPTAKCVVAESGAIDATGIAGAVALGACEEATVADETDVAAIDCICESVKALSMARTSSGLF